MSAKEQAILDIRQELQTEGKCFIAFRSNLNPIMDQLVKEQIFAQEHQPSKRK